MRYDDIYRMDEIKVYCFRLSSIVYIVVPIVSGNNFSSFEWRSLYAAHHGAWRGDRNRWRMSSQDTTRSSFLNNGLHLWHCHAILSTAVLKQPILSRWNSNNRPICVHVSSVWEEHAFSFLPTLNNYINTLICIRIPVFASILINSDLGLKSE